MKKTNFISFNIVQTLMNSRSDAFAVSELGYRLTRAIISDEDLRAAVSSINRMKHLLMTHGATEAMMTVLNADNQLGKAIGMEMPAITADNCRQLGKQCVENINGTVDATYETARKSIECIVSIINQFVEVIQKNTISQAAVIRKVVIPAVESAKLIDAKQFSATRIFGYAQTIYMKRVSALAFIIDNLKKLSVDKPTDIKLMEDALLTLGQKIVVKTDEQSDTQFDDDKNAGEPDVIITPESHEEAEANSPDSASVMNPKVEDNPSVKKEGVPSTEEDVITPMSEIPADAAQERQMAELNWTPESIGVAAEAVLDLLGKISGSVNCVTSTLGEVKANVSNALDAMLACSEEEKLIHKTVISNGRVYAGLAGKLMVLFGTSVNELVDQLICMSSAIITAKAVMGGQSPATVTSDNPTGQLASESMFGSFLNSTKKGKQIMSNWFNDDEPVEPVVNPEEEETPTPETASPETPEEGTEDWWNNEGDDITPEGVDEGDGDGETPEDDGPAEDETVEDWWNRCCGSKKKKKVTKKKKSVKLCDDWWNEETESEQVADPTGEDETPAEQVADSPNSEDTPAEQVSDNWWDTEDKDKDDDDDDKSSKKSDDDEEEEDDEDDDDKSEGDKPADGTEDDDDDEDDDKSSKKSDDDDEEEEDEDDDDEEKSSKKSKEDAARRRKKKTVKNWWDDGIEEPDGVPSAAEPLDTPKGVDPNTEADPGKATHVEPVETPEEDQPDEHAEKFLEDVFNTRLW